MNESDKATLATLERLIVRDLVSVAKALETAYSLGELEGQLKIARIAEAGMQTLLEKAA
jgi:hypothetical protein